jgi:hypothetical protein
MKKNWTIAAIALILSIAAVVVAFMAGKNFANNPDLEDPEDEPEETDNTETDGKE